MSNVGNGQILQNILMDQLATLDAADDLIAFGQNQLGVIDQVEQTYDTSVAAITGNADLTDAAKQARIGMENDRAQRERAKVGTQVQERVASTMAKVRAMMTPTPLPKDDATTTALLIERRAILRDMDPLEIGVIYLAAAQECDDVTLAAIDGAASYDKAFQISPDTRAQGQYIRANIESPDGAAQ